MSLRERHWSLIVTFESTAAAMAAEKLFQSEGIPGRMIPVPREITAGCGLAWKAEPADREVILKKAEAAGVHFQEMRELYI